MAKENKKQEYDINAILQSIYELKEAQRISAEAQRISAEKSEKEWAEWKEAQEKARRNTDRQIERMSKEIGGIGRSNGYFAEENILNALERDMTFAGIQFDDIEQRVQIQDETRRKTLTDIDIIMSNHEATALIEVKHRVEKRDVNELLHNKLKLAKDYFPELKEHKIFLGIGGGSFEADAMKVAKENGIGVIKVVGDKVEYYTDGIKVYLNFFLSEHD